MHRRGRPAVLADLAPLITATRAGDPAAAGELVRRFQDMAYATAFAYLGDHHRAEDAAQEAFLTAFQDLPKLREPAAFPGWFRQIVRGACGRLTRGRAPDPLSLESAAAIADGAPTPDRLAEARELGGHVHAALRTLPEHERLATILYYIGDYTQAEVATFLGVPVTTVKKRLYAARQRLRARLLDMVQGELRERRPSREDRFAATVQLVAAVKRGDVATVGALLGQDPTLLAARDGTKPLLQVAALHGFSGRTSAHKPLVDLLLARGAPYDLFAAAYLADAERAATLLAGAPDLVDERDPEGLTPLHHAADRGASGVARLLLDHGADANAADAHGQTPLHRAGHAGPWKPAPAHDLVQLLIERGATLGVFLAAALGDVNRLRALLEHDPQLVHATDTEGRNPLYHAAHNLHLDAVALLLAGGADVNRRDQDGQTALGTAITHSWDAGAPAVVERLRAAGADLDFFDACSVGDVERVRHLLRARSEHLQERRWGETPLHFAARWGQPGVAEVLLQTGLDVNVKTDEGATPLDAAARWGKHTMVEWLKARGGTSSPEGQPDGE